MLRQILSRAATAAPRRAVATPARLPASCINTARFLTSEASKTPQTSSPEATTPLSGFQYVETKARTASTSETPARTSKAPAPTATKYVPNETAFKPRKLTYLVERTKSKLLPVYDDVKSGGTRKFTIIRKIQGNAQDLKKDLINELRFKKDDVNVNPVTGHVAIKGYHQAAVKLWLEARGM